MVLLVLGLLLNLAVTACVAVYAHQIRREISNVTATTSWLALQKAKKR